MSFGMRRVFLCPLLIVGLAFSGSTGSASTIDLLPEPTQETAFLVSVSEALEAGELDRAERLLRSHLQTAPEDAIAWEVLGVTLALQGTVAEADAAYGKAVELDPNRLSAWVKRGDLAEAAGDAPLARDYWRGALDVDPTYRPANERLGRAYAEAGDVAQAVPLLEAAVAAEVPDALGAKVDLALVYNRVGRADDTLSLLAPWDGPEADPVPAALLALGNAHVQMGDPAAALERYERGLDADPQNTSIARAMGALLVDVGQTERGAAILAAPAAAEPVDAFANLNYARALAALGRYPDAITAADRAAQAAAGTQMERDAVSVLARAHLLNRERQAAVAASARLVELAPEDVASWREYIAIVAAVGAYDDAHRLYSEALEIFAGDPQLLRGRSITNIRLDDLEAAAEDAAAAVEAAPNWVEPRYLMGEIARAQGQSSDAEAAFRGVLEIDPEHWPSLLNLARLAQEAGALSQAQELATRAVAASGGAEAAQQALDEITQQVSNQ